MSDTEAVTAELTPRQREWLRAVLHLTAVKRGIPPTVRELGDHMGITSTSTTFAALAALQRKGAIVSDPGKNRSIRVLRAFLPENHRCPTCGRTG